MSYIVYDHEKVMVPSVQKSNLRFITHVDLHRFWTPFGLMFSVYPWASVMVHELVMLAAAGLEIPSSFFEKFNAQGGILIRDMNQWVEHFYINPHGFDVDANDLPRNTHACSRIILMNAAQTGMLNMIYGDLPGEEMLRKVSHEALMPNASPLPFSRAEIEKFLLENKTIPLPTYVAYAHDPQPSPLP